MLGFDPLTLSAAYILASLSASQCPAQGEVDVNVHFTQKDSPYITSMTAQQMDAKFAGDTSTTRPTDGKWMVAGLTKSNISAQTGASFASTTEVATGAACFTVKSVDYNILYAPDVYIASDFLNMGCRYSATVMHEKRHVTADVQTLTDFMPDMKKEIEKYAETIGPQGPYPVAQVENEKQRVLRQIDESLKSVMAELWQLRQTRQAQIDTLQNYQRDTALCPGQFPKFDGSK